MNQAACSRFIGKVSSVELSQSNRYVNAGPTAIAMATDWPAYARLVAVAPAGQSVAAYTTSGDTTGGAGKAVQSLPTSICGCK